MTSTQAFRIDPQKVIYEVIDGEAIVIQLELGNYYSLGGCGPEVLEMLGSGFSTSEISRRLTGPDPDRRGEIEAAVERLVAELVDERLLEPDGAGGTPAEGGAPATGGEGEFIEPVLEKYTDMQDFLLVDPIHGVGEEGWPSPKPDG